MRWSEDDQVVAVDQFFRIDVAQDGLEVAGGFAADGDLGSMVLGTFIDAVGR